MCVTSAKNIWIQKLFLHVCCFLRFDRASVQFLFWAALGSYKRGFVKYACLRDCKCKNDLWTKISFKNENLYHFNVFFS